MMMVMSTLEPRRRRRLLAAFAAVILVLVVAFGAACNLTPKPVRTGPLLPASATALPTYDAARFHQLLASLKGKPVLVNAWNSFCGPCIKEAALLAAASRSHPGIQFIGLDVQDHMDLGRTFIRRYHVRYPSVFDPLYAIGSSLGMRGQPCTAFYDRTGRQVAIVYGALDQATLSSDLAKIFA
jgi:thiol-disulfide isomerase/thioredoxin